MIGEGAGRLVHREGEALRTDLHAVKDAVDLHALKQRGKALRADAQLHEAVGVALRVMQRHADVLAQIARHLVGLRLLDHEVHALQQLAELVALLGRILAQHEVRVGGVRGLQHALAVEHVQVLHLQHVGQLLELVLVLELGVAVKHIGGHLGLAQVALVVLLRQRGRLLVGARHALLDGRRPLLRVHGHGGQREQRLHVERGHEHGQKAHERQHDGLSAHRLVEAHRAEVRVVLGIVAAFLVLAHDEQAVEDDHGQHREEHEQDHAHGEVARGGQLAFGNGAQIVRVVDLRHAAVQALAVHRHPREGAVLEVGHVDAQIERVGAHEGLVGMVGHEVVARGHGEHVAALAHAHVAEHAAKRARLLHELVQLGGILLDHRHEAVVDAGGVVAQAGRAVVELHLHRLGGLARVEHGAQLVVALVGEIGARVLGAGHHGASAVDHHHVAHAEQIPVLGHLGVGGRETHVVVRHEGHACGLGLIHRIERLGVLRRLLVSRRKQAGKALHLVADVGGAVVDGQLVLHRREDDAHQHDARHGERGEDDRLDLECTGHGRPPS